MGRRQRHRLLGRGFQLADGLLNLVSHVDLQVLDVTHEKLLQAAQQIGLLRLADDAYQFELQGTLRYLMELC